MRIQDGSGQSRYAAVNEEQRLLTESETSSAQHRQSIEKGYAFQVSALIDIAASEKGLLCFTNREEERRLVITYIRLQSIGAAAANENAFFKIILGGGHDGGGSLVAPVNMNVSSNFTPQTEIYSGSTGDLVHAGGSEIDRNYEANSMQSYNKEGAIILSNDDTLAITHTGSTAAGKAYCRISFYFVDESSIGV